MDNLEILNRFLTDNGIAHFCAQELCIVRSLKKMNIPPETLWSNILSGVHFLEFLRKEFGPIRIISGYRNPQNNRRVGGANRSQHMQFRALDCVPVKGSFKVFKERIQKMWWGTQVYSQAELSHLKRIGFSNEIMGLGLYTTFVHIDFGYRRRSW